MNNGVYLLIFKSINIDFGTGILVVNNNIANGGDTIYSYTGEINDTQVVFEFIKHNIEAHSLFGNVGKLKLNLTCHPEPEGYLMKGNVENIQSVPLVIKAKFIGHIAKESN
ncbi:MULTISPECIES: GrlR family regulatory protein [unclassified Acinetobacter]|uniref:GrlR family regulatory protein n=1 Tax=unclassified Acinetobacter TaxID=196816 RepID=UPI000DD0D3F8|nr:MULTISPECIES: GrlR family regulatory protein [unclassified Acinetobacter]